MAQPRFSIVVPTRNRAETLPYCLQTCLVQDFDDYEIVVCDNCSTPETRAVVDQLQSPKIKYVRSPEPLAMYANWELALSHATGEYVTILGDDDGFMPYGLRELDRIFAQSQFKVVGWDAGLYTWPSIALPEEANYLTFKITRTARSMDGKAAIGAVLRHELGVQFLPMILNACVHQSIISQIRDRAGRVFLAFTPDSSAGIAVAYVGGSYLRLDVPMTLSGLGPKSNNVSSMRTNRNVSLQTEFWNPNATGFRTLHPWVPDIANGSVVIAESFLRCKEALFPDDSSLVFDRSFFVPVWLAYVQEPERQSAIQKIRATLTDSPEMQAWFDQIVPQIPPARPLKYTYAPPFRGSDGDSVYVSADRFGIQDIAGAVAFVANFLGYKGGQINYDLPARIEQQAALQQAIQQLAASQARIKELEGQLLGPVLVR